MSELHTSLVQQEMEESGEMDFIRQHVAAANAAAKGEAPAPAAPADTVEQEQVEEEEQIPEESGEEEVPAVAEIEPEAESDDVLYLELDEDTQALLDSKYGGDLNAMLKAAREAQSLIGRQGNELGELRKEMEEWRAEMAQSLAAAQPYPEYPDEYADGQEAAVQLRRIAEEAFRRQD